jgi:hypothetical protein
MGIPNGEPGNGIAVTARDAGFLSFARWAMLALVALLLFANDPTVARLAGSLAGISEAVTPRGDAHKQGGASSIHSCRRVFPAAKQTWRDPGFAHAIDVRAAESEIRFHRPEIEAAAIFDGLPPVDEAAAAATRPVYFAVDVDSESAYAHWMLEFSVYLREWESILLEHPHAKILIGSDRMFKRMTFALFGMPADRLTIAANTLPRENYCIFLPWNGINDYIISVELFIQQWDAQVKFMLCRSGLNTANNVYNRVRQPTPLDAELGPLTPTSVLVMPRGKKDNYSPNDRSYPGFEPLMQWTEAHNGRVLHTDNVTDLRIQIRAIASARIVVLPEGSAFFASGPFAASAVVIVVGTELLLWQSGNPKIVAMRNYVEHSCKQSCNRLVFVASAVDVLPTILQQFSEELA